MTFSIYDDPRTKSLEICKQAERNPTTVFMGGRTGKYCIMSFPSYCRGGPGDIRTEIPRGRVCYYISKARVKKGAQVFLRTG